MKIDIIVDTVLSVFCFRRIFEMKKAPQKRMSFGVLGVLLRLLNCIFQFVFMTAELSVKLSDLTSVSVVSR